MSFQWPSLPKLENIPQVSATTREKPSVFPLGESQAPIALHCMQSNSRFPIKHERIINLIIRTPESTQEHPDMSRMTLMSRKRGEIVRCIPNHLDMIPNSPVLDLEQSPIPHHTRQVACLTSGNSRDSLRHTSQI